MNDNARTRRTALFAVTAILLAIGGDAFGEAVCYWPIARFVVWGLESQLAFHAVLLTAILIGCIITGRVADFPKAIIGASLMMAAQTPLAWRYWTTHTGLTHSEWVATQMVPPILILLWLLRAQ